MKCAVSPSHLYSIENRVKTWPKCHQHQISSFVSSIVQQSKEKDTLRTCTGLFEASDQSNILLIIMTRHSDERRCRHDTHCLRRFHVNVLDYTSIVFLNRLCPWWTELFDNNILVAVRTKVFSGFQTWH